MHTHDETYLAELISKQEKGIITPEEKAILDGWYDEADDESPEIIEVAETNSEAHEARLYRQLTGRLQQEGQWKRSKRLTWLRLSAVAASIMILGLTSIWYYKYHRQSEDVSVRIIPASEVFAGGNKAILTRGDGKQINLTDLDTGIIANANGIIIKKSDSGLIEFTLESNGEGPVNNTNTIETPAGGQYRVILPDGSIVTLNALSSVTFPDRFSKNERNIKITGEAFLEVRHDKSAPFRVKNRSQDITVLGTNFNVNAYDDEPYTRTTLQTGSIQLETADGKITKVQPGQQAVTGKDGQTALRQADMQQALAWKNDLIYFKNASIPSILRQVSRWYGVQVSYEGEVPNKTYTGGLARSSNLQQVLDLLAIHDIHFKLVEQNGVKTLLVKP